MLVELILHPTLGIHLLAIHVSATMDGNTEKALPTGQGGFDFIEVVLLQASRKDQIGRTFTYFCHVLPAEFHAYPLDPPTG